MRPGSHQKEALKIAAAQARLRSRSRPGMRSLSRAGIATGLSALDPAVRATKHAAKTWPDDGDVPLILRGSVGPTIMRSDRASCHEGDHPASLRCSIFGSKRARKISASSGSSKQ